MSIWKGEIKVDNMILNASCNMSSLSEKPKIVGTAVYRGEITSDFPDTETEIGLLSFGFYQIIEDDFVITFDVLEPSDELKDFFADAYAK